MLEGGKYPQHSFSSIMSQIWVFVYSLLFTPQVSWLSELKGTAVYWPDKQDDNLQFCLNPTLFWWLRQFLVSHWHNTHTHILDDIKKRRKKSWGYFRGTLLQNQKQNATSQKNYNSKLLIQIFYPQLKGPSHRLTYTLHSQTREIISSLFKGRHFYTDLLYGYQKHECNKLN